ncbi:unnamed protein product [Ilex paraguariensis]|uniref:Prolamin-like domain-containing protein n=1 Tax=Ilex paraguariensis TaxID=185542 RepID=A0ABC8RRI3_9AQUA
MPSTSTICSTALIATCISTLAALSIAHDLPGGRFGGKGGGLGGFGVGPGGQADGLSGRGGYGVGPGSQAGGLGGLENGQCLASLNGVQGCIQEVLTSVLTLQFRLIGPDCCQAILNIDDNCWPKVLPLSPIFPLKNYCTQIVPGFAQPAPPTA